MGNKTLQLISLLSAETEEKWFAWPGVEKKKQQVINVSLKPGDFFVILKPESDTDSPIGNC